VTKTQVRWIQAGVGVILLALLVYGVSRGLERMFTPRTTLTDNPATPTPESTAVPHITATLFYATADGQAITGVRREVPLASGTIAQGRAILNAQLEGAPEGYLSAIPNGTSIRGFYITAQQDAFIDFSPELSTRHPGGSTTELLTVYAIVNTVVANLPTIQRVQILIDGKEVDTLAGHVDLRGPLRPDLSFVRETPAAPATR
jgi:spore germination protein GerM